MMLAWIIVFVSCVIALCLVASMLRQPAMATDLDRISVQIREIEIDCLQNLTNPAEQQYLRENLPLLQFRWIHLLRMTAAVQYLWGIVRNARLIVALAEAAGRDSSPVIRDIGQRLQRNASLVCLRAFLAIPRAMLSAIFPSLSRSCDVFAGGYCAALREASVLRLRWASRPAPLGELNEMEIIQMVS